MTTQFDLHPGMETFGLPYDYQSVMHYPVNAFAVNRTLPTIVPKKENTKIGDAKVMSSIDASKLRIAYGCPLAPNPTGTGEEIQGSTVDPGKLTAWDPHTLFWKKNPCIRVVPKRRVKCPAHQKVQFVFKEHL